MSVDDIAALLSREGSGLTPDEYDESVEQEGALTRRTELLGPVLETCQQLWDTGNEELDVVSEKLGDGSRDGEFLSFLQWVFATHPVSRHLGCNPGSPGRSGMARTLRRFRNSRILP